MSVLTLYVDEVMRTLSNDGQYPFVVNDKTVDIVRFALNTGFTDVVLDEQTALRVMYQRPGETEVRAQTLTYYDTDGLRNYYDWQLLSADLTKKGVLTVALCILRTDGDVEEWHTTPCQIRVLDTIHTDDSDEADESITPTVAQRVAVLETMIQRVASGAPIVVASTSAMTDTDQIYVLATDGKWYYHNGSSWVAGGTYGGVADGSVTTDKLADGAVTSAKLGNVAVTTVKIANKAITKEKLADDVVPDVDPTLSVSGMPADAKVVGDEIADLKSDLSETENEIIRTAGVVEELECGLTEEVKATLLACFAHVAWISDDGQTHYDALSNALNRSRVLSSIRAVFTQGSAVIYDTDELYSLKQYLTVTATYSDATTKEVNNYTLSGKLVAGTSTITVAYNKKTTTFNVTVTHQTKTLESISATFNSSASITTDNVLDDLRPYLTVLATYADSTTSTITNYSLSGNLNVGTNTITVSYGGKTTTFTVNVTQAEKTLQSITAVFNQGSAVIYTDNTLNDLKPYLTVTARYSDSTTQIVTNYTLSGTLRAGTSTITASYGGKTTTFNVTVTQRATLQSISATFTQGSTVIYTDNTLDDLKPYLVVTANYSDSTTATVTNYTLSGTLVEGTSTITVTYSGKTTTFNVTVTKRATPPVPGLLYSLPEATTFNGSSNYIDTGLQLLTANKTNLTIVFDGFTTSLGGASQTTLLHCMHEISPWPGLTIYTSIRRFSADLNSSSGSGGSVTIKNIVSSDVNEARIKCVWIIDFTSMKSRVFLSVNDTLFNDTATIASAMLDVNITENALIGCYQTTDGTKGRFWTGTMYDYKIYDYTWTENAANAYLQEDHS